MTFYFIQYKTTNNPSIINTEFASDIKRTKILVKMESIQHYNTDTGRRDLGTEKYLPKDTPFCEVLQMAIELRAHLITKTSYVSEKRPGQYYIKGYRNKKTYDEIKEMLDSNLANKKYTKINAWLIKY